ncbi:MAG: helix-turn-helix domain-containing protein [Lentisphaerae bacterium]|jgi:DNA-binding XRE family transcriptional regulator|nr:helix-turn-helix domain-containing protein [Lentisphaerota bacterium]
MDTVDFRSKTQGTEQFRWERGQTVVILAAYREAAGTSQREFAQQMGVPRSTLQHWLDRKASLDLEPEVADFFESPVGLAFLRRLTMALHLVFEENGSCGLRHISHFLELTGLDCVVASSYGSQQKLSSAMETEIIAFGEQERLRLGAQMPRKDVALCEDETFHPRPCLVAIEPVSGYIPVETYCDGRDAATWNQVVQEGLEGLSVNVIQCVSDEARGLLAHARDGLGAHHSPDLFHVQQELSHATVCPLASQRRRAEEALESAHLDRERAQADRDACQSQCPQSEVGESLERQVADTQQCEAAAEARLVTCQQREQRAKEARRGLGHDYHPFDTVTGQPCDAEEIARRLNARFDEIESVAGEADLSERCQKKIAKARRVLVAMLATIAFFWRSVQARLQTLSLSPELEEAFVGSLLSGHYFLLASAKASKAERRHELRALGERLLNQARDGPLSELPDEQQSRLEQIAEQCAALFQRSSSSVEGRNGRLALWHHSLHRLSEKRLRVLTVLHNFFIRRSDGTTAAERFFETAPGDLFTWLLDRLPDPARPAT